MSAIKSNWVTARNVVSNWGGYVANILVAFFLSPYVVHTLGDVWYGVWTLLLSITGYMGLLEMGVVVTTGRMVYFHHGRGEQDKVSAIATLSLLFFLGVGLVLFTGSWIFREELAQLIPDIPDDERALVGYAFAILSVNVALGLVNALFSVLLQAKDRFDLKNGTDVTVLLIRSAGTIAVLEAGMGIWGLVWVTLGTALTGVLVMSLLAWRKGVWPRWNPSLINRGTLREITGFSAWAFLNQASIRIFLYTDTVIIGLISGSRMVTYYTIAFMLVDYGYTLAAQVTNAFIPSLGRLAGAGDDAALRETLLRSVRLAAILGIPIMFGIFFFAQHFIGLWMGEAYAWAGALTSILIAGKVMGIINGPMGAAIWSVGNIKPLAIANIAGAVLNAVASASILLYTDYGLHGVAVVSAITIFILNMVVVPIHGARLLNWPLVDYLAGLVRRWVPAALVFSSLALLILQQFAIDDWWSFFATTLGITLLYGVVAYPLFLRPALRSGRW